MNLCNCEFMSSKVSRFQNLVMFHCSLTSKIMLSVMYVPTYSYVTHHLWLSNQEYWMFEKTGRKLWEWHRILLSSILFYVCHSVSKQNNKEMHKKLNKGEISFTRIGYANKRLYFFWRICTIMFHFDTLNFVSLHFDLFCLVYTCC